MADFDFLRPPPAYQEYASDLLIDRNYRSMSLAERGLVHTLRLELWISRTLPGDTTKLAELLRFPLADIESAFTTRVGAFFEITEHAITCPELDRQKAKLERRRQRQSEGGVIGGQKTQERLRGAQGNSESYFEGYLEGYPEVRNKSEFSRDEQSTNEFKKAKPKGKDVIDPKHKWSDSDEGDNNLE